MESEKNEKIIYDNPLQPMRIWRESRNENVNGRWHYHHELEIISVIRGCFSIHTKDAVFSLSEGSVAIIGSYEPHHTYKKKGEMEYIVLQFDIFKYLGSDLMPCLKVYSETGRLFSKLNYILNEKEEVRKQIVQHIHELLQEYSTRQKGYQIAIHSLIHRIILLLLRNDTRLVLEFPNNDHYSRLYPVLEYIEQHIEKRIDMKTACRLINLSYYHFGRYFRQVIGKSFTEYVNYRKMQTAERLLLTKDLSILEIAASVGMTNMANFYKVFKAQNQCTPSAFRRKAFDESYRMKS